jgi:hypothetical protein
MPAPYTIRPAKAVENAGLVPKEMKVEHSGRPASLTDEQTGPSEEAIEAMLVAHAGGGAKVMGGGGNCRTVGA